jgi:hypothetical protein
MVKPRAIESVPPGDRHIRVELTAEHQAKLRVVAAQAGMSMAAYARAVLVREIESTHKRAGA